MRSRQLTAVLVCVVAGGCAGIGLAPRPAPTGASPAPVLKTKMFSGVVVGPDGAPAAGAEVTAFAGLDTMFPAIECLKIMGHTFGVMMGQSFTSCGCSQNAAALTEAIARLEAPPVVARVVTGAEGTFTFEVPVRRAVSLHARLGELEASASTVDGQRLVLGPLVELKGRVTSHDKRGIAGARVLIIDDVVTEVVTGPSGEFSSRQTDGPKQIVALKEGLLPDLKIGGVKAMKTSVGFGFPPQLQQQELTLELGVPLTLTGKVVYRGTGAGGIEVQQRMVPCAAKAITGDDGTFVMTDMREQSYHFVARSNARLGDADRRTSKQPIVIELADQVLVRGTVRSANGAPLGMATLNASLSKQGNGRETAWAKDDGTYELGPLAPGEYTLTVEAEGWKRQQRSVVFDVSQPVMAMDFALEAGLALRGRVTDAFGTPIERASIEAVEGNATQRLGARSSAVRATSGAGGAFSLAGLAEGQHTLWVTAPGFIEGRQQLVLPADGVVVKLTRSARLFGSLTTATGAMVTGARVTAELKVDEVGKRVPENHTISFSGGAPVGGSWEIMGLRAGEYVVVALAGTRKLERLVSLAAGQEQQVDLKLPDGKTVSGTVVDEAGVPVRGAVVGAAPRLFSLAQLGYVGGRRVSRPGAPAESSVVTTGDNGRFEISGLGDEKVAVLAERAGYRSARVEVVPSAERVMVTLTKTGLVTGRVIGGGVPLQSFRVGLVEVEAPDGRFEVDRGTRPTLKLEVKAEGWAPLERTVELPPQGSLDVGDLVLAHGRVVTGKVKDSAGAPVGGATVTCKPSCGSVNSERSGSFTLEGVPSTSVELEVRARGFKSAKPTLGSEARSIDIVLDRGLRLLGRVLDENRKPMTGLTMWYRGPAKAGFDFTVDVATDGTFEIAGLQQGQLELDPHGGLSNDETRWIPKVKVQVESDRQAVEVRGVSKGSRLTVMSSSHRTVRLKIANEAEAREGRSDREGTVFIAVPRGRHTLLSNGREVTVDVVTDDQQLTIE